MQNKSGFFVAITNYIIYNVYDFKENTMGPFFAILKNVIIFVALAIPGYFLSKKKIIKPENCGALSNCLTYIGVPFLIFSGTLQMNFTAQFLKSAIIAVGIFAITSIIIYFLSIPLTAKEKDRSVSGMMRFGMIFSNNGFLGLPLAYAAFPEEIAAISFLIIMNLLQNVITIDVGRSLVSSDSKSKINFKSLLLSPALIAFVVGIILNLLKITSYLPEVNDFSNHLKNIVTPISMTILGVKLGGVKVKELFSSPKTYYVSFIKLIVLPIIGVALAFACVKIFSLPNDLVLATFIAFAMPVAGLASTIADKFGGDEKGAVYYTLGSTVLSVITIPLLYLLLSFIM